MNCLGAIGRVTLLIGLSALPVFATDYYNFAAYNFRLGDADTIGEGGCAAYDEFRIFSPDADLDANWVAAQYATQSAPNTFAYTGAKSQRARVM